MGLFDFFKSKKNNNSDKTEPIQKSQADNQPVQQSQADEERFEKEIHSFFPRYLSASSAEINLFKFQPLSKTFSEQFKVWQTVQSLADRRGIIYTIFDQLIGPRLKLWQIMERFVDDRKAEHAKKLGDTEHTEEDLKSADYWASLAKTNFVLANYSEAEANALKALQIDANHKRAKINLADIYHFRNKAKEAHDIYNEIVREYKPKDGPSLHMYEIWGYNGILNSPIYAASWLKEDKTATEENWDWAGEEFYYSPHFRSQHAYHLIEKQDYLKGFVKLLNITMEMPWFREAVLNTYDLIDQLNYGEVMKSEKVRLKSIIDRNNWTRDHLHPL
ncbi:MAG TPA: hypothetical protein VGE24_02305 [Emticicia sp.]